jgi:hypothetical protein
MKRVILTTVLVAVATTSVFAQGTVSVRSGSVHVGNPDNTPVGFGVYAQMLGAPGSNVPEASLLPGLGITSFRTGAGAGEIAPFTATFNNIAPDAPFGSFEVVAWDNSSGLYPTWLQASMGWEGGLIYAGRSQEFTLANIGGQVNVPPAIPTLSFRIGPYVPEPSAAVLIGLGAAAFLHVGRSKSPTK